MKIVRLPAVKAAFGWRSHASVYNDIKAGLFTEPVKIGVRSVGWPDNEVEALCAARVAGLSDDQIRELVDTLHGKRAERLASLMA